MTISCAHCGKGACVRHEDGSWLCLPCTYWLWKSLYGYVLRTR